MTDKRGKRRTEEIQTRGREMGFEGKTGESGED